MMNMVQDEHGNGAMMNMVLNTIAVRDTVDGLRPPG